MTIVSITSRTNPRVKGLVKALKARFDADWVGVEGEKLIAEARRAGLIPDSIWSTSALDLTAGVQGYLVPDHVYRLLSPTKSGRPPLAVFKPPELAGLAVHEISRGRWLVLDRVQAPGNAGALVRAAAAFGFDGILWHQPCVYPFHHACIRASAGAVFHVQHYSIHDLAGLQQTMAVIGADAHHAQPLVKFTWPLHFALVLGSEGGGLSADIQPHLSHRLRIETTDRVESLNVAGAAHILMHAAFRHQA